MNLFKSIILSATFSQILLAQVGNQPKLLNVDLGLAFSKPQEVLLSQFIEELTFVPLETTPLSLIGKSAIFEVTKDYIIVRQLGMDLKSQILLFDKLTGKYIREVGKYGKGPGEYLSFSFIPFNPIKNVLYTFNKSWNILVLDSSGKIIDEINTRSPAVIGSKVQNIDLSTSSVSWIIMLDADTFVGYVNNTSGKEDKKIILLSKDGVIKIFRNHLTWNRTGYILGIGGRSGISQFYKWDNQVSFYENFCDTLYYITKESLVPRYYFDWGKNKIPYSKQGEVAKSISRLLNSFLISQIYENKYYIFLKVFYNDMNFLGYIDKEEMNVIFCKPNLSGISTFKDDLYNLLDIIPLTVTEENEMVFVIEPQKLLKWFKENLEKGSQIRQKQPILNNIDEFSNPIIIIGNGK